MNNRNYIFTIVRHGETDYKFSKVLKTNPDFPLNEAGRKQANLLRCYLQDELFTKVFTSPLIRARETTSCILENVEPGQQPTTIVDDRVRERELGLIMDGSQISELAMDAIRWGETEQQPSFRYDPVGAETYENLKLRVSSFFQEICGELFSTDDSDKENVLIVSHGLWIRSLLDFLMSSEEFTIDVTGSVPNLTQLLDNSIQNAAIIKLKICGQLELNGKRKFQVLTYNDNSYL